MSKLFYLLAVIAFIVLVAFIVAFMSQNPTIIETHAGHGGRGHPHGSGSRHYDGGRGSRDWRYGSGSGWWGNGWWGNGWWGNTQPTYFNHHKNRHNRHNRHNIHHQRGGWWFF